MSIQHMYYMEKYRRQTFVAIIVKHVIIYHICVTQTIHVEIYTNERYPL